MKKLLAAVLALAILAACAGWAEEAEAPSPTEMAALGGEVTGDFDEPALSGPEARYTDYFMDETDGSEEMVFMLLDSMNDEAEDMRDGALLITENWYVGEDGAPGMQVRYWLQQSPFGAMMISRLKMSWADDTVYFCGTNAFMYDGETLESVEGFSAEDMEFYTTSYHFPYGRLEMMQGVRQDENGYTYFFVKSDDSTSFEFVIGEGMRIQQLRVYTRDEEGVLKLNNYVDYGTGPALEVPQAVLDAFGAVMEPAPESAEAPETDANGDDPAE